MADINLAGFGFDPSKARKFGWATETNPVIDMARYKDVGSADPYAALYNKYKPFAQQRIKELQQISGQDKSGLGLAVAAMNDPLNLMLQSELQGLAAQKANQMSRENLKLAEEAAIRKQSREFTFGQLGKALESIPRAFGSIPFDLTQDVVANIANIASPSNIKAIPQVSPAGYSYTPTKYYS